MPLDIVVTIPKSEYVNDDKETLFMNKVDTNNSGRQPKKLNIGDRMYFVKNGVIGSSMRMIRIETKATVSCEVTNRTWNGCLIFMDDLRQQVRGFQGF